MARRDRANAQPVTITRIRVRPDRIVCELSVAPGARRTTPAMAQRALAACPNLARHACVNGAGDTFGAVIAQTPVPHLLEHLTIDMLTSRSENPQAVFTGTSEWVDHARGIARVALSFEDDLAALAALRDAVQLLNEEVIR